MAIFLSLFFCFIFSFQENIHSIMGSEDQVLNLMRLLDRGIQRATEVESKLNGYDAILKVKVHTPLFLFLYEKLSISNFNFDWYFLSSLIFSYFFIANYSTYNKVLSLGLKISQLHPLQSGKTPTQKTWAPRYDTKLHQVVRLHSWNSGECGVLLHCHYFLLHSASES